MKKYVLPTLVAMFALGLSGSAAYFSVLGLTKLFAGAVIGTAVVCSFIEGAKLIIASVIHQYGKKLGILTNIFLVISLLVAMSITSIGVYGYLTNAYQSTANKVEIVEGKTNVLKLKRDRYQNNLNSNLKEKSDINIVINELTKGISNNVIQYRDKETNQIITTTSSSTRKVLKSQLEDAKIEKEKISINIETFTDSITNLDVRIMELNSNDEISSEIGPLKFIQKLTDVPIEKIINILTLVIVLVVDPLAIVLVIVFNKITKRKAEDVETIILPEITEQEETEEDLDKSIQEIKKSFQPKKQSMRDVNPNLYGDSPKGRKPKN